MANIERQPLAAHDPAVGEFLARLGFDHDRLRYFKLEIEAGKNVAMTVQYLAFDEDLKATGDFASKRIDLLRTVPGAGSEEFSAGDDEVDAIAERFA